MRKVAPDDPQPPFQQIADDLRSSIRSGDLPLGGRLPKQAELADAYGVSLGTLKAALTVLRDEELIVSRQGEGSWVRRTLPEMPNSSEPSSSSDVHRLLSQVLARLDQLDARLGGIEERLPRASS